MIIDNIDVISFLPVRDQGLRPLCLVFSSSALHSKIRGFCDILSIEDLAHHAYDLARNTDYKSGLRVCDIELALNERGHTLEANFPYETSFRPPIAPKTVISPVYRHRGVSPINSVSELIEKLKVTPAVLVINICENFYNPLTGMELDYGTSVGCHAVLSVGLTEHEGQIGILIKNSWGDGWGNKGFLSLPVEYVAKGFVTAFFMEVKNCI